MKKSLLFISIGILMGCTHDIEVGHAPEGTEGITGIQTRSLSGAVYNEVTKSWMVPQKDPYSLANFQAAYEKLSADNSSQTLSQTQVGEFAAANKLQPTHYALKIYPRNEKEQRRVETMEDVQVAYIPFDYAQLTEEEVQKLPQKTRSAADTFSEKSPYTVTYHYTEVTDGGTPGPRTFQLPILYTVWPVDKPLPEEMDYQMDYEVFLPPRDPDHSVRAISPASLSKEAMQILEREAVCQALGLQTIGITSMLVYGTVRTYDTFLGKELALANVKVRSQIGSSINDSYSNPSGSFTSYAPFSPSSSISVPLTFIYQDPEGRWKITIDDSEIPHSVSTQVSFFRYNALPFDFYNGECTLPQGDRQANEIHRALNYYYYDQTDFPKFPRSEPLRVAALSYSGGNIYGNFYPTYHYDANGSLTSFTSFISMYNNSHSGISAIGATLHEIGHAEHFQSNPLHFKNTHGFLKESYASYVGWYSAQEYYKSQGWIYPGGNPSLLSLNARQGWTKTLNGYFGWFNTSNYGWYSPLFVDLTDSYNQSVMNSSRPDDEIENVPPSVIWNIISTSTNWTQCRSKLQSYVGTYYTAAQFNNWIADFDYWMANYQ